MSSVKGEHLNCDLDPNDPTHVCIGHGNTGANGIYRMDLILEPSIYNLYDDDDSETKAVIMAHISRPSHNHRLLNSQVIIKKDTKKCTLRILIRKEAPCDILLFLELWMTSPNEPYSFEGYGSLSIKRLLLQQQQQEKEEEENNKEIELKDVSDAAQGLLNLHLVKPKEDINLLKTCSEPESLTNNRILFKNWLEKQYHPLLVEKYKKLRPEDSYHWYTSVQCPHERVALGTIVYMTRHISFPDQEEGRTDHIWDLLFDLAYMEFCCEALYCYGDYLANHWFDELTSLDRAKIINYMFTLPLTGFTYVTDRIRGPKGKKMDTDIWSFLRTRPMAGQESEWDCVGAAFDCEDASLYMMESIYVFKNSSFEKGSILEAVQKTLREEYQEWFTLCMLRVQGSQYEAHATVVLQHRKGGEPSLLLEGTCLTSGISQDSSYDKAEMDYYDEGYKILFDELQKVDSSIAWNDMIQYSMPRSVVKREEMYKTPMTMVCAPSDGVVKQRVFDVDAVMDDAINYRTVNNEKLEWKDHPEDPPEFQPISWFDCCTVPKEHIEEKLDPYDCACNGDHIACWFYYTSICVYKTHKQTIDKALSKEQHHCAQIFNAGRECCLVRICVCRLT